MLRLSTFPTDVANVLLTGLSTATNAVITAADNVLSALGKLQAQINLRAPLASPTFSGTVTIPGGTINGTAIGATTPSTGAFTTLLASTANFSGTAPSGTQWQAQGALIGWNYSGSGGETDFINSKGLGAGGFNFYNVASSSGATPTLLASIGSTGSFTAVGGINATSIGGASAAAGSFTTLSATGALTASGTVSGAGFTSMLAPYAPLAYVDARVATTIAANNTFANTTYSSIFPGVTFNDGWEATNIITSTSTALSQYTAIAGYIRNQHAQTSGGNQNGVALFGAATAEVDGAAVWGVNTLLQDSATRAAGSGTGRILIGYEVDFNVMSAGTQVIGCSIGGNGLAQPTNATGFIVNTLGSGIKWSGGFVTEDGAANYGIAIGASAATAGANFASQMMAFNFYDFNSTKQSATIQVTSIPGISEGNLVLSGSTLMALTVNNGNINMSSASSHVTIGGNAVVGARVTGMGSVTGGSNLAFNAATATLQQTAGAAAYALQVLINHGLLGP